MRTSRWTSLLLGLTLALFLLPAGAQAQKSGFFFRGNVGAGYSAFSADDANDTKLTGGSGMVALALGAFVKGNVAIYGEIFGSSIAGPTVEWNGSTVDTNEDLTATFGGIGAGATIYTRSGVYFGGTVGVATLNLEYDVGAASVDLSSDPGLGLSFLVGKEWRVGNKWGLGVAGHAMTGVIPDKPSTATEDVTWTPMAFGIDFTFTYVAGGYR